MNHSNSSIRPTWRAAAVSLPILGLALQLGCDQSHNRVPLFEPNLLYARSLEIAEGLGEDGSVGLEQPVQDSQVLLTEWFGTLNDPKIPPLLEKDYADLISLENLKIAAGPPPEGAEPGMTGLYRQQCASCHGESGQGRGPVAASQNPYPRDFRHGLYKFKSTSRNSKPLKADFKRILKEGLGDSQMPKFAALSEQQLDALVDYVIFLSIRGEMERKLYYTATFDLDLEEDRIYDVSLKNGTAEDAKTKYEAQVEEAEAILTDIADSWNDAEENVEEFDEPEFPIFGSETEETKEELVASIAAGKELFIGKAGCAKCHGESARGDGAQAPDYDDWTRDWTARAGLKFDDTDSLIPLMALGGLKPQPMKPRDIVAGHFRGGSEPIDVYRRIRYGIPGSTMPAITMARGANATGLTNDELWHLVNFILSIKGTEAPPQQATL